MALLEDSNTKVKTITPKTDIWGKSNTTLDTSTRTQESPDSVLIKDGAKASIIDYSTSTFDNDLTGSVKGKTLIKGGSGADVITGGNNADTLNGGAGSDNIFGGKGNDVIDGGNDNDILSGGTGNNTLTGGDGFDLFVITGSDKIIDLGVGSTSDDGDSIQILSGVTNITVADDWYAGSATINDGTVNLTTKFNVDLTNSSGSEGYTIKADKKSLSLDIIGSLNADTIIGSSANDTINGGQGNDLLTGGLGDDTYIVTAGTDSITDFGLGNDVFNIELNATANITVVKDYIASSSNSNNGTVTFTDKSGSDIDLSNISDATNGFNIDANKSSSNVMLKGSILDDTISGGSGKDSIDGGNGNDTIHGGKGNDAIVGGAGDDIIYGGAGKNFLIGGAGSDTFVYLKGDGVSTIIDFTPGTDNLHFSTTALKDLTIETTINLETVTTDATHKKVAALIQDHGSNFVYDKTTGNLYFDADISGAKSNLVLIETLGTGAEHPALTGADISIIA